jgi:hypothetical protein
LFLGFSEDVEGKQKCFQNYIYKQIQGFWEKFNFIFGKKFVSL